MALPASGPISLSEVNVELGLSSTAQISLNDAAVRALFGVASGAIDMQDGYGKSSQFAFSIASNQINANLRTLALNAGWNGTSKVVATIASGVYVSSNSTGTPGLTVNGSFPGGVELINQGFIIGMGGRGGNGGTTSGGGGSSGGGALSVASAISITNNGTIGGGGGGGGGGGRGYEFPFNESRNGGGGGGGRSGTTNSSGGSGASGASSGAAGTSSGGGGGGAGQSGVGGTGGTGGGWGSSGATGGRGASNSNGDSGWPGGGGGSGGYAVSGNGNVTWIATGTRLGSIS